MKLGLILLYVAIIRNIFTDSLARVFQEGSTMDESTIFKVPLDLLEHMDLEGDTNFDAYLKKLDNERETNAKVLADRVKYLQVCNISCSVKYITYLFRRICQIT